MTFRDELSKVLELNKELESIERDLELKRAYFAGQFQDFVKRYSSNVGDKVGLAELVAIGVKHAND